MIRLSFVVCGGLCVSVCVGLLILGSSAVSAARSCDFSLREPKVTLAHLRGALHVVNGAVDDPSHKLALAGRGRKTKDAIPVFLVRQSEAHGMVAHVRSGCRAILVGSHEFETAFSRLSKGQVLIENRQVEMLALLLLHELGHIVLGHHGAFIPSSNKPTLNLTMTASKAREDAADAFATRVLREEFEAMGSGKAFVPAAMLTVFLANLSLTISTQNTLNCFGCRVLGSPDIFWDHSHSHENLEYRLLKMNHAIVPTQTSKRLLDDFERQRATNSKGGIQVIGPDGKRRTVTPESEEYKIFKGLIDGLEK